VQTPFKQLRNDENGWEKIGKMMKKGKGHNHENWRDTWWNVLKQKNMWQGDENWGETWWNVTRTVSKLLLTY
jgi:hypothetical protein